MSPRVGRTPGRRRWPLWLITLVSLAGCVALWQGITWIFSIPAYLLPSPVDTVRAVVRDAGLLAPHVRTTVIETFAGLAMAIGAGLVMAIVLNASRLTKDLVYPPLVLSQAVPLIAIAPIILIWFGLGMFAKVLIVAFVCFFPITVNAYEGFRSVEPAYGDLLETLGATRWDRYRHLYIPATLPGIFAGLKIAATYSVLGAVVGEWLGGSSGLGVFMIRALQSFRTDRLFGAIVIVMLLSYAVFKMVDGIGHRLTPWLERRHHG